MICSKSITSLLLFFTASFNLYSQNTENAIEEYLKYSEYYLFKDDVKSLLYAKNAAELAEEQNIKILEQKLKVSVDELIDDAKNDRDSFLEKFQIVYPEFYNNLLSRYPNLNSGELKLLAYIYLNFSTKEIATHTFRSYRTIQSRKYLLRKKLGLESHEDFYIWLRNIGNSSLSL